MATDSNDKSSVRQRKKSEKSEKSEVEGKAIKERDETKSKRKT